MTVITICVSIVMAENRSSTTQMLKISGENVSKTVERTGRRFKI